MQKVVIQMYGATPYMRANDLAEKYGFCTRTVRDRIKEIKESGRYKRMCVVSDHGTTLVNEYVFLDWLSVRKKWANKNARKYIDPFVPSEWAEYMGTKEVETCSVL